MEIEGTVYLVLPPVTGQSQKGNWSRQEMVIEFKSGDFNRKLSLSFWGDKTAQLASLKQGELVKVHFDLESREYNGRWFTTAQAWRVERGINTASEANPFDVPPMEEPKFDSSYDEPF